MARENGTLRTLKTVQAIRNQSLTIDLGKTFEGTLTSWMKKDIGESEHIEFTIKENRYLFLEKSKTQDLFDTKNSMAGRWRFDVRLLPISGTEDDERIVFAGTILFHDNITI
ncbi:unnamed protein product [marine sediment metagenome]|uniref:Uncharacterized protein n=1 Tax=marine sediment metagenome TaxID=412755 RepID=X1GN15_9ZZZZ